ncbi:MAG: hypothetical protein EBR82_00130 [Caulobacteraceae bacterium]|nr:hypothetical protein [Caulobacteraceae bacterium]
MNKDALKIALALEASARLVESGRKDVEVHFTEAEVLWSAAESLGLEKVVDSYLFGWQMESRKADCTNAGVVPASNMN